MEKPDLLYETVSYIQLENPVLSEVPNSQFDEGKQEIQESGMRLEPNRDYTPWARANVVWVPYASDRRSGD